MDGHALSFLILPLIVSPNLRVAACETTCFEFNIRVDGPGSPLDQITQILTDISKDVQDECNALDHSAKHSTVADVTTARSLTASQSESTVSDFTQQEISMSHEETTAESDSNSMDLELTTTAYALESSTNPLKSETITASSYAELATNIQPITETSTVITLAATTPLSKTATNREQMNATEPSIEQGTIAHAVGDLISTTVAPRRVSTEDVSSTSTAASTPSTSTEQVEGTTTNDGTTPTNSAPTTRTVAHSSHHLTMTQSDSYKSTEVTSSIIKSTPETSTEGVRTTSSNANKSTDDVSPSKRNFAASSTVQGELPTTVTSTNVQKTTLFISSSSDAADATLRPPTERQSTSETTGVIETSTISESTSENYISSTRTKARDPATAIETTKASTAAIDPIFSPSASFTASISTDDVITDRDLTADRRVTTLESSSMASSTEGNTGSATKARDETSGSTTERSVTTEDPSETPTGRHQTNSAFPSTKMTESVSTLSTLSATDESVSDVSYVSTAPVETLQPSTFINPITDLSELDNKVITSKDNLSSKPTPEPSPTLQTLAASTESLSKVPDLTDTVATASFKPVTKGTTPLHTTRNEFRSTEITEPTPTLPTLFATENLASSMPDIRTTPGETTQSATFENTGASSEVNTEGHTSLHTRSNAFVTSRSSEATTSEEPTVSQSNDVTQKKSSTTQEPFYGNVSDSCNSTTSPGGCFWTKLIERGQTDRALANKTCISANSVLAVIPSQQIFVQIREDVRMKLTESWSAVAMWLGMTFEPGTNVTSPIGSFDAGWRPGYPTSDRSHTGMLMAVKLDPEDDRQGLMNRPPDLKRGGVVCWKPSIAQS